LAQVLIKIFKVRSAPSSLVFAMAGRIGVRRKIAKKKKQQPPPEGRRSRADKVQAQGVGKTVSRAFGGTSCNGLECWDAFHPAHLPLPRAVGPYTVVRTTSLMTSSAKVNIIGAFQYTGSNQHEWTTIGMFRSVTDANAISASGNTLLEAIPLPGAGTVGSGMTAVPAAISVQVMNSNPLQTTEGICAGAVSHTQLNLKGRTETWNDFASEFISFMRPRLMSAGKLALRGVQMDSYPLNMAACAEFAPVTDPTSGPIQWSANSGYTPMGWAPLVFINQASPNVTPVELQFLVTVEWRVRFDIGNPAVASHRNHGVTSDAKWSDMINAAVGRGHGVLDIVEKVANTGAAVLSAASAARSLAGLMA
jgi:hypothetical protein